MSDNQMLEGQQLSLPSPWTLASQHGLILTISSFGVGPQGTASPKCKVSLYSDPHRQARFVYLSREARPEAALQIAQELLAEAVAFQAVVSAEDMGLF